MVDSPGKLSSLAAPSKLVSRLPHTQEGRGIQEPEEEPQTMSLGSCVSVPAVQGGFVALGSLMIRKPGQ